MALLERKHIQNEREQQTRQQIEGPEQVIVPARAGHTSPTSAVPGSTNPYPAQITPLYSIYTYIFNSRWTPTSK